MAQWLRVLADLPEDIGPIPCTHMEAHNHVLAPVPDQMPPSAHALQAGGTQTCMLSTPTNYNESFLPKEPKETEKCGLFTLACFTLQR